ncbi:hypothetical protein UP09_03195 [Bradyrhizobium sp. LTSP885]|uniref:hypothetical protein n=1 Tax=Bradyrhizobium sp. LTSP885 TaxID=1619232 RepID=UPI0005C8CBAE|nr:hypothetical protein [Bradyrhizobium sp. LTSP885]KJC51068.1 hypothetical protein UP09_03195 [Bradyrhizobium sp. LTSP885]
MKALNHRMQNDEYQARLFVNQMMAILQDYIPRACHRDMTHKLYDHAIEHGLEMTTKAMRYEYEAWKAVTLNPAFIISGENLGTGETQRN